MEFQSVLAEMGKCQELGLTKSIGVSNFSCKKMENLLVTAKIVPAFNQVEMNIVWQQRKLSEFCMTKGITMTGYSPLGTIGTSRRSNRVMGSKVVKEISKTKGKTHSQVCLRWLYERGVTLVVKSFSEESMKENLEIFEWELTEEQNKEISQLPQRRGSRRYGMEKPDHKTSINHVFLRSSVSMLLCAQRGFNYSKL